jgi:hypothetical protein
MSHKYLGENFDIHGGGIDLIFPHHTNEIAQSRSAFPDSSHARYWVHNGFLTVDGNKMSKSIGNFVTVKNIRDKNVNGEVLRLALPFASSIGLKKVLLTCDDDNLGSLRTIEANGGILQDKLFEPGMKVPRRRYWINL